jgi:predicted metal-binding membrane protein
MAWMRMPGQTWLGAAASFVGMWVVMMIAMMLPSIAPVLWTYRQVLRWMPRKHVDYVTTLIAVAYFLFGQGWELPSLQSAPHWQIWRCACRLSPP